MNLSDLQSFIESQIKLQTSIQNIVKTLPAHLVHSSVYKVANEQSQKLFDISSSLKSENISLEQVNEKLKNYHTENENQCKWLEANGLSDPLLMFNTTTIRLDSVPVLEKLEPIQTSTTGTKRKAEAPLSGDQAKLKKPRTSMDGRFFGEEGDATTAAIASSTDRSATEVAEMLSYADTLLALFVADTNSGIRDQVDNLELSSLQP